MYRAPFKIKDVCFGETYYGTSDIENLIPKGIPYKFQKEDNPWVLIANQWFKMGLGKDSKLTPVYGIDKEKAIKHIQCLFNTWALSREVKVKNAAYLMSTWFTEVKL